MKAIRVHTTDGPAGLVFEDAPQPKPLAGEILVRVYATGITPTELGWSTTWETETGTKRQFPIPGHDLSGVVAEVGDGVTDVRVGMAVYALTSFRRDGAEAEYAIALPSEVAPKPRSLDHVQAAAIPLSALTAWQALFDHVTLSPGNRVLIHGAAGGVGTFAVQLARWAGTQVIGTASGRHQSFLRNLGCDATIDYTTMRFEDMVHDVDVVLDAVGGDMQERSWGVLKKGGTLVSVAKIPSQEQAAAHGVRGLFFIVEPNREQLVQIGDLIDAGAIRPVIDTVFPLSEARPAYEQGLGGHTRGKIVLKVSE
jgi:NADPH:quinone reductase-like Zn-dependent oxidoreductase